MAADAILLADAIRDILAVTIPAAGASFATANVTREYEVTFDLGKFTLMQVPIIPSMYGDKSKATRSESNNELGGTIIVTERYTSPGKAPNAWIDERVNMVESAVFVPLNVIDYPLLTLDGVECWPKEVEVSTIFDMVFLRKHKVFWSEIDYTFSKLRVR